MKYIFYILIVSMTLVWYLQGNNTDVAKRKQVVLMKDTSLKEQARPLTASKKKIISPKNKKEPSLKIATSSIGDTPRRVSEKLEDEREEVGKKVDMYEIDEEKDTTPPPPKSQEELDDEAEAEHAEAFILEEDSDEIGVEKPDSELEDEAGNRLEGEIKDEEESKKPIQITKSLEDETGTPRYKN